MAARLVAASVGRGQASLTWAESLDARMEGVLEMAAPASNLTTGTCSRACCRRNENAWLLNLQRQWLWELASLCQMVVALLAAVLAYSRP